MSADSFSGLDARLRSALRLTVAPVAIHFVLPG